MRKILALLLSLALALASAPVGAATRTVNTVAGNYKYSQIYTVAGVLNGDQSASLDISNAAGVSVIAQGTAGAGFSWNLEASGDGATWTVVGTANTTLGGFNLVAGNQFFRAKFFRVNITAGDGTTNVTFYFAVAALN